MAAHRSTVFATAIILGLVHSVTQAQVATEANGTQTTTQVQTVTFDSGDISTIDSFRNNSAELTPVGLDIMRNLFLKVSVFTGIVAITVTGHTSSRGSDSYNLALSERRAATVARLLSTRYPDARMTVVGMGERLPVTSNDTPEGEARNRRVEVSVSTQVTTTE